MNALNTFRFRFEPDAQFPGFSRLHWDLVPVALETVMDHGIHPWSVSREGYDLHPSLVEAFLRPLNDEVARLPGLASFGYCSDLTPQQSCGYDRSTRFERTLKHVSQSVYFVEDLPYLELLEAARNRLRERWSHSLARGLALKAFPVFHDLRAFFKARDKRLKLSGYEDLERCDLSRVVSVEDFEGRESLVISEAMPSPNFRRTSVLGRMTDGEGRLRLTPAMDQVTVTSQPSESDYTHLAWHVARKGDRCRFLPDLASSDARREKARRFARQWREDEGRYCFTAGMDRLCRMVDEGFVVPSFPGLNYTHAGRGPRASAQLHEVQTPACFIGSFPNRKTNGADLREILREHGVAMTGNTARLLQKLARLAADQYEKHRPGLDAWFSAHRYIRITRPPRGAGPFPLLEDVPRLRNLLLSLYVLRHLRGDTILEAAHHDESCTPAELAHALLTGKVELTGGFLRVL